MVPAQSAPIGMTVMLYVDQDDLPASPFLGSSLFSERSAEMLCDSQTASTLPVHLQFILVARLSAKVKPDVSERIETQIKVCRETTGLDFQLVLVPAASSFVQAVNIAAEKALGGSKFAQLIDTFVKSFL